MADSQNCGLIVTNPDRLTERLDCIHILERRMLELSRNLRYVPCDDTQRKDWESQHKALSEAAAELRSAPFVVEAIGT